jgi:Ala-tRNA(Pro) deacylase
MALATHASEDLVAKSLLIKAGPFKWLAVIPADFRLDEGLLRNALEKHSIHLVPEEELELLFPNCEVGAMPPLGNLYGVPVIVDKALAEQDEIVFHACTHTESVRMRFADFERLANPMIAEIGTPRARQSSHVSEDEASRQ